MPRSARVKESRLFIPVLVGVLAIIFTITILVAWNIIFTRFYVVATESKIIDLGVGYWVLLSLGCLFLVAVVSTLVLQLVSNVRKTLAMRQQTAFIDSVTHELRSPLASLMLGLDTLERRELSAELQTKFLATMRADVDRLRAFIEHVIEAGRLEHEEREMHYVAVALPELAESCVTRVVGRHGVAPDVVRVHFDDWSPDERTVVTDRVALETILVNLLDNAVKYSVDDVAIDLRFRRHERQLAVEVADDGVGIPRHQLKKVFHRFHRVERASARPVRGTGLGLYVVATLVRRLGGNIFARSEGENRGATFVVNLPLRLRTAM